LSPQTRRGRAVPDGHRKKSPRPVVPAPTRKVAEPTVEDPDADLREPLEDEALEGAEAESVDRAEAAEEDEPAEAKPIRKAALKTTRRGAARPAARPAPDRPSRGAPPPVEKRSRRRASRARRHPMASAFMGWVRAYLPLLGAFVVLFTVVWAYNSFAPHTPSPAENWQRIENKWKGQFDEARAAIQTAAASNDVAGQIAGYKDLAAATQGWVNDLQAVDSWNDSSHTTTANQTTAADMLAFKQAGQNLVQVIDTVIQASTPPSAGPSSSPASSTSAGPSSSPASSPTLAVLTPLEALQRNSADLVAADQEFTNDYRACEYDILGATTLVTPVATLSVPTPPPSAEASASASASAEATQSPSAPATATPSASPAPSASGG
jgi:hypothetical protein